MEPLDRAPQRERAGEDPDGARGRDLGSDPLVRALHPRGELGQGEDAAPQDLVRSIAGQHEGLDGGLEDAQGLAGAPFGDEEHPFDPTGERGVVGRRVPRPERLRATQRSTAPVEIAHEDAGEHALEQDLMGREADDGQALEDGVALIRELGRGRELALHGGGHRAREEAEPADDVSQRRRDLRLELARERREGGRVRRHPAELDLRGGRRVRR